VRRPLRGLALGVVLALLAFPSGGCISEVLCPHNCKPQFGCGKLTPAQCGSDSRCMLDDGECKNKFDCDEFGGDENACSSHKECYWEGHCL
jgi:hypothetical protein